MKSLPIRVRLTLWYSLAIAVTLFSIGLACLWMVHRAIGNLENEELEQRVRGVRRFLESRPPDETLEHLQAAITADYNVSHGNKWLQVIDEHGNWIYRSPHVAAAYPALALPQQAPADGSTFTYSAESRSVRALIEPISVHGTRYTVQTGMTLNRTLDILFNFRIHIFLLITAGLFVSSIAGHLMSRKALDPVSALAARARLINDRNLDVRLPVPDTADEISHLSTTLNQMLERIGKAFASVRAFTGDASHELRTPISLLRAEIEVALFRPRDGEEYRAVLGRLLDETVKMTSLVENLLFLARADGGAESLALAPIRIDALFRQVADTWQSAMSQAMLDFHVDCPRPDLVLVCNAQGVLRLLSILIENAVKYTPPGGAVTMRAMPASDRIDLSVQDTGIGIAAEHQVRIFDRFYRVAANRDTVPAGSGLGLALGRWIAERHGTELRVESEPGTGSRFSFSLQEADSAPAASAARPRPDSVDRFDDLRIRP
jgi:heavy metal sensor kinase